LYKRWAERTTAFPARLITQYPKPSSFLTPHSRRWQRGCGSCYPQVKLRRNRSYKVYDIIHVSMLGNYCIRESTWDHASVRNTVLVSSRGRRMRHPAGHILVRKRLVRLASACHACIILCFYSWAYRLRIYFSACEHSAHTQNPTGRGRNPSHAHTPHSRMGQWGSGTCYPPVKLRRKLAYEVYYTLNVSHVGDFLP
jgi:hypothetical protein